MSNNPVEYEVKNPKYITIGFVVILIIFGIYLALKNPKVSKVGAEVSPSSQSELVESGVSPVSETGEVIQNGDTIVIGEFLYRYYESPDNDSLIFVRLK